MPLCTLHDLDSQQYHLTFLFACVAFPKFAGGSFWNENKPVLKNDCMNTKQRKEGSAFLFYGSKVFPIDRDSSFPRLQIPCF